MSMKLVEFRGEQSILVRWQTRKPQKGDHMTIYGGVDGQSGRQAQSRLILKECIHRQIYESDRNTTEEWWSFMEVSESEFQRIRKSIILSESIEKTHDMLF